MFVKYSVFITCMYLLRDMPIVMCIYLIQIHTFLLFNVLKREVSNVFLYIWTINYSYSYFYSSSYSYFGAIYRPESRLLSRLCMRQLEHLMKKV